MKATYICIFTSLILLMGCSPNGTNNTPGTGPIIEEEFLPFYFSFLDEMQSRGINLADRPISVVGVSSISAPNSSQFCAYGFPNFGGSGDARVEVITNYNCWNKRSNSEKENLMYHEFGHALLNRSHFSGYLPNGSPKSLMCTATCSNYGVYNEYQPEQKNYYLDELASNLSAIPNWASTKLFSSVLQQDNFDSSQEGWISETITEDGVAQTDSYSYFIEANSTFSSPNALAISTISNNETNSSGNWSKSFNLENFEYCSNLIVSSDLRYENLTNGSIAIIVDLFDDTNSESKFARYYKIISSSTALHTDTIEGLEVNVTCLPLETAYFKVRFYLETQSATSAYFDNLKIELYE